MRKLLILICTLALMVSVFGVTASADTTYTDLRGVWKFNDVLSFPSEDWTVLSQETILFTDGYGDVYTSIYMDEDNYNLKYKDSMTDSIVSVYAYMLDEWHDSAYQTITITDGQASEAFKEWLTSNATELFCDGSCPVGDANVDGYCEDCKRSMQRVSGETTQKPANTYPEWLPGHPAPNAPLSVIVQRDDGVFCYVISNTAEGRFIGSSSGDLVLEKLGDITVSAGTYYTLEEDGYWHYSNIVTKPQTNIGKQTDILWSNEDIYDVNGKLFFPLPLWALVERVTEGGLATEIPTLHSSMVLLAVFGIGLLALLIGLILLPKVLRKFL